jgi:Domain of unknown function (DUF4214)
VGDPAAAVPRSGGARRFRTSAEYPARHADLTADLAGLYADVLGRRPDEASLLSWQHVAAQGAGREELAQDFLTSAEAYLDQIDTYYGDYLGRRAAPGGQAYWLGLLQSGRASPEAVGVSILASAEYPGPGAA